MTSRERALALDAVDPLAPFRDRVVVADPELLYLDGNSLGRLPHATRDRLRTHVEDEWGGRLVRGWHDWVALPSVVGDELGAALLGVGPGETLVCDNTSSNLFKLAVAAMRATGRRVLVTDDDNFPTDRHVLAGVADLLGAELRVVHSDRDAGVSVEALREAVRDDVGLVSLSHTAYRSGALAPVAEVDALAHAVGALTLWDLSHSVGAVPVDLSTADLAVGCTYKYVNAGPGAPAWLWVRSGLELDNPVQGWFGAADPFAMDAPYAPAAGAQRFLTGTPPVGGLLAVQEGVRLLAEAGLPRLRTKGQALTSYLVELADAWLAPHDVRVASPRDADARGSHVVLEHPRAWQLVQELVARGVVPDYRVPDRVRFGPAPLYTRFVDVHDALAITRDVLASGAHLTRPAEPARVT
ncbi:MAG: kynureninase [Frankiales bacterium]|nr:kynureninase [Frankiales bacterium]